MFDEVALSKLAVEDPIETKGNWSYFSEPEIEHRYVFAADVSEGLGRDHSTVAILDITPLKPRLVATYKNNKIAPDLFAFDIKDGATKYHYAFGAPERNNHGHTTISKLREIYPEHLLYADDKKKIGWQTNLVSKPKMMYDLGTAVNNELIDIPSKGVVSEMRQFDKEDLRIKNYDDEATQHFDLLTAVAIALQMKDFYPSETGGQMVSFIPDFD